MQTAKKSGDKLESTRRALQQARQQVIEVERERRVDDLGEIADRILPDALTHTVEAIAHNSDMESAFCDSSLLEALIAEQGKTAVLKTPPSVII